MWKGVRLSFVTFLLIWSPKTHSRQAASRGAWSTSTRFGSVSGAGAGAAPTLKTRASRLKRSFIGSCFF